MREPTIDDVRSIANQYGLRLSPADLEGHLGWLNVFLQGFTAIDQLPDDFPALRYPVRNGSLSRMRGNSQVRFLGGWVGAIPPGYPTGQPFEPSRRI